MSKINDGGPAFPRPMAETSLGGNYEQDGMTLRDWFAGQAFPAIYADLCEISMASTDRMLRAAKLSLAAADAMLAAREGETP